MTDRVYCSEIARHEQAPLCGTAVHVEMWLLLEYPRPWKPKALVDNDLPDEISRHLGQLSSEALAANVRLRVQFIKQASSADIEHPRVFLADGRAGSIGLMATELDHFSDFAALRIEDLLAGQLPAGKAVDQEILLVCTNGQRDLCCARFGLPLYEALAFEYGQRVWQTTHVGGHRYAPNLLCLPSGLLYGHVMPDIGAEIVAQHDRGEIALSQLRGRSAVTTGQQAAEYFVRRNLDGYMGALSFVDVPGEQLRFSWETDEASGEISLTQISLGEVLASCGKAPKEDYSFELHEFIQRR